jgi:cell division protein FtsB
MHYSVRHTLKVFLLTVLLVVTATAQETPQERGAKLRAQLVEAQAKEAELQTRLQQLEEDLKPENIERSLAGIGSTHPEDLRAARRRQLEIERKGLQSQLEVLAASRTRLEAAIARADADSYQQSVGPGPNAAAARMNDATTATKAIPRYRKHRLKKRRPSRRARPRSHT